MNDMLHLALLERQQIGADAGMIFPSNICAKCSPTDPARGGDVPFKLYNYRLSTFERICRESFGCIHI